MDSNPLNDTRNAALNSLARREHSEFELTRKLRNKGYTDATILPVIKTLIQEGLLSNSRFTENYIHYRRQKGYGPLRIHAELLARGVPEDVIEHHLKIADNVWFAEITAVWRKRFKGTYPCDYKDRAQQMRFLNYRGFTPEQINHIFNSEENV